MELLELDVELDVELLFELDETLEARLFEELELEELELGELEPGELDRDDTLDFELVDSLAKDELDRLKLVELTLELSELAPRLDSATELVTPVILLLARLFTMLADALEIDAGIEASDDDEGGRSPLPTAMELNAAESPTLLAASELPKPAAELTVVDTAEDTGLAAGGVVTGGVVTRGLTLAAGGWAEESPPAAPPQAVNHELSITRKLNLKNFQKRRDCMTLSSPGLP